MTRNGSITLYVLGMTIKPLSVYLQGALRSISENSTKRDVVSGFSCGFENLDYLLGGISSDYFVIGSRCWDGLARFGLQIGLNFSKDGHKGAVFDLSNSPENNVMRILSLESKVSFDKIRFGIASLEELGKIMVAAGNLENAPLIIEERKLYTMAEMEERIRFLVHEGGCEWIIIDNLNVLDADSLDISPSEQLIEKSQKIRDLQAELQIPIITLLELQEDNKTDQPSMVFRREAECCIYDAGIILLLRSGKEHTEKTPKTTDMEVFIVQQPGGCIVGASFEFFPQTGIFKEV